MRKSVGPKLGTHLKHSTDEQVRKCGTESQEIFYKRVRPGECHTRESQSYPAPLKSVWSWVHRCHLMWAPKRKGRGPSDWLSESWRALWEQEQSMTNTRARLVANSSRKGRLGKGLHWAQRSPPHCGSAGEEGDHHTSRDRPVRHAEGCKWDGAAQNRGVLKALIFQPKKLLFNSLQSLSSFCGNLQAAEVCC